MIQSIRDSLYAFSQIQRPSLCENLPQEGKALELIKRVCLAAAATFAHVVVKIIDGLCSSRNITTHVVPTTTRTAGIVFTGSTRGAVLSGAVVTPTGITGLNSIEVDDESQLDGIVMPEGTLCLVNGEHRRYLNGRYIPV